MFDNMKINLLNKKFNILCERQLDLLKSGKYEEAEKVGKEIEAVSNEIQEISGKKLEKTEKKFEKEASKLDKELKDYDDVFGTVSEEEGEKALSDIMRGK